MMMAGIRDTLDAIQVIQGATTVIGELTIVLDAKIVAVQVLASNMSQQPNGVEDRAPNEQMSGDSGGNLGGHNTGVSRDIFQDNSIMRFILSIGDFVNKFTQKTISKTNEYFQKGLGRLKGLVQGMKFENKYLTKIAGFVKTVYSAVYDVVELAGWIGRKIVSVFAFIGGVMAKGIGKLGKWLWGVAGGLDTSSKLQTGYNQLLTLGKQAVNNAFERIRAEQELQKVMGNTNQAPRESVNEVGKQAKLLSTVTAIDANTGMAGQAQLAQYVTNPDQVASLTEPLYNLATEMFGVNVNTDQIKQAADLMGKAMNGSIDSITRNGEKLSSFLSESERQMFKFGSEAERADLLIQMLNEHTEGVARSMGETPEGKFRILQGIMQQLRETIGLGILPGLMSMGDLFISAFSSGTFDGFISAIIIGFNLIIEAANWVVELLLNNWDSVMNALAALGIAAAIFAAIWFIQWVIATWPLLLIVGVIFVLIQILNAFGISTGEIIGFVIGLFFGLFGSIYNVIAFVWNLLVSFAEFLANIFIDPVFAIKKMLYDLVMDYLGFMHQMAVGAEKFAGSFIKMFVKAINGALKAVNWLVEKINGAFDLNLNTITLMDETDPKALSKGIQSVMDWIPEPTSDQGAVSFDKLRLSFSNPTELFNKGFDAATKLTSGDLGADSFLSGILQNGTWGSTEEGGGAGNIGTVNRVNSLGGIDEQVDISSEDLKVMRDLAEMKAIQNFVTLTPTVQVTTGDIRNGDDVDTMISKIEEILTKQITSTASGVYG